MIISTNNTKSLENHNYDMIMSYIPFSINSTSRKD